MIKVGTNVKSKIHDDLTGHVVICQPMNNYAVIMTDIIDYEMMTVECFLSDLEASVMNFSLEQNVDILAPIMLRDLHI